MRPTLKDYHTLFGFFMLLLLQVIECCVSVFEGLEKAMKAQADNNRFDDDDSDDDDSGWLD